MPCPRTNSAAAPAGETFTQQRPMEQSGDPAACPQGHDDTVRLLPPPVLLGRSGRTVAEVVAEVVAAAEAVVAQPPETNGACRTYSPSSKTVTGTAGSARWIELERPGLWASCTILPVADHPSDAVGGRASSQVGGGEHFVLCRFVLTTEPPSLRIRNEITLSRGPF